MVFDPSQGDSAQLMDIMQLQAALAGYSLVDPTEAEVTPGSADLTVDVAAAPSGVRLGGPSEDFDGDDGIELPDPDPDDPRKALVYIDSTGNVQTLGGPPATPVPNGSERTQAGVPTVPVPTEDYLPLAEIWISSNISDITEADIASRRVISQNTIDFGELHLDGYVTGWPANDPEESEFTEVADTGVIDSFSLQSDDDDPPTRTYRETLTVDGFQNV